MADSGADSNTVWDKAACHYQAFEQHLFLEHMGNDGKQRYVTKFYNLDAILSVGYRVNSRNASLFRQWASSVLKEYLLKGYSVNQRLNRLEQLQQPYQRISRLK